MPTRFSLNTPPLQLMPSDRGNKTMLPRCSSSPFQLFDRLEQQFSQHLQTNERVPAAEVHATPETDRVVLELSGIDKAAIKVMATERTLLISSERRCQRQLGDQPADSESTTVASGSSAKSVGLSSASSATASGAAASASRW